MSFCFVFKKKIIGEPKRDLLQLGENLETIKSNSVFMGKKMNVQKGGVKELMTEIRIRI